MIKNMYCRDKKKCFENGCLIRHRENKTNNVWIAKYDKSSDRIICLCNDKSYDTLSGFTKDHYTQTRPDRNPKSNGWNECEYQVDGIWISTKNILC